MVALVQFIRNTDMSIGLIGKKCGMTRVFTEAGVSIPVTVIEVAPNRVTQIKTDGSRRASRVNKAAAGHFAKAGVEAGRGLWEFRVATPDAAAYAPGAELTVGVFTAGQKVDVTGTSIGKGFAGTIKRHHFSMGDATHGNSLSHRAPGSIGQRQTPGRVFPNMKMSGHMGNRRRTTQSLELVSIDEARGLLLVKGAVPGAKGGDVIVRPAVKA
jgi:large subunit ribosomal protein L3